MTKRIYVLEAMMLLKRSTKSDNPKVAEAAKKILENGALFNEYVELRIKRTKEKKRRLSSVMA